MKITGRLENWYKDEVSIRGFIIWGFLYNDRLKRFRDGSFIHTSFIEKREIKEGSIVKTLNSKYKLGKPMAQSLKEQS